VISGKTSSPDKPKISWEPRWKENNGIEIETIGTTDHIADINTRKHVEIHHCCEGR
jgi:hypothetical protein